MSTTQTINGIIVGGEGYETLDQKLETAGSIQKRFDDIGDDFVLINPSSAQVIGNKQSLTSTGNLTVGATGSGNTANLQVYGTTTTADKLTVSSNGADITGNTSTTGTLTSGGALTVGTAQTNANATINGNLSSTGTTTSGGALTVSSGGATITGNSSITGTATITGNSTIGATGTGNEANLTVHGDVGCVSLTLPIYTPPSP